MEQIGYSLVDGEGTEIAFWGNSIGDCPKLPECIVLPNGDQVYAPRFGKMGEWQFVPRMGRFGSDPIMFDGTNVVVSFHVTEDRIVAERERRFALGFDYDFKDSRGVHRIGTTPKDMEGWDEVTKLAQAAINLQRPDTPINIKTNTGAAQITALEWQSILLAAAMARQPLWAASFLMMEQNPIRTDFQSDAAWK